MLTLILFIGLAACDSDNNNTNENDTPDVAEENAEEEEIEDEDEDEVDEIDEADDETDETTDEDSADFQLLYNMTAEMMAVLYAIDDSTDFDAVLSAFEEIVSISDAVVENETHSEATRGFAYVVLDMSISQAELFAENQDELRGDDLELLIQIGIDNIQGIHDIFEENLGE